MQGKNMDQTCISARMAVDFSTAKRLAWHSWRQTTTLSSSQRNWSPCVASLVEAGVFPFGFWPWRCNGWANLSYWAILCHTRVAHIWPTIEITEVFVGLCIALHRLFAHMSSVWRRWSSVVRHCGVWSRSGWIKKLYLQACSDCLPI